ncbi:MAG: HAD family hydrolase [Anaerolineae bacterium]|nr:HAD family hydrolase [Anaerolineae bacterium]
MTIKAVVFDLGGTLLHYHDDKNGNPRTPFRRITMAGIRSVVMHLINNGISLPPIEEIGATVDRHIHQSYQADLEELRGSSIEVPIRAALAELGADIEDQHWAELRPKFYESIDGIVFPRSGLHETLEVLREVGYLIGLVSNTYWAGDLHDRHLKEQGIFDYFPVRIYSCDSPFMKPHPGIFNLALDELEVAPEEAAYVGDRPDIDVAGAQAAGMYGILIDSPYRTEELGEIQPDAIIAELPDLPAALIGLEG